jgi:hypothetical protein
MKKTRQVVSPFVFCKRCKREHRSDLFHGKKKKKWRGPKFKKTPGLDKIHRDARDLEIGFQRQMDAD